MVKVQTEVDRYRGEGGGDPQKLDVQFIRVQTVFQAGVWFCYKYSRQVSGSALDNILVLFLAFQVRRVCLSFTAKY